MRSVHVAVLVTLASVAVAVGFWAIATGDESPAATGDVIAFSCRERANPWYAVCLAGRDGTERRAITEGIPTTDPAWSPDGRSIAFTHHAGHAEYERFTEDTVYLMDSDGGNLREIAPQPVPGQSSFDPTWSPTGDELAYLWSDVVAIDSPVRFGRLAVMALDGGARRPLDAGALVADPAWSPDGRSIALTVGVEAATPGVIAGTEIHVIDLVTGERRSVTNTSDAFETAPTWSPDSSRIAFARTVSSSPYDGASSIHVVDRDGSGERKVLAHTHYASGSHSLSWSPDGTAIAFETSPSIVCAAISVVDVRSRAVTPVTTCARAAQSTVSPSWQPAPDRGD